MAGLRRLFSRAGIGALLPFVCFGLLASLLIACAGIALVPGGGGSWPRLASLLGACVMLIVGTGLWLRNASTILWCLCAGVSIPALGVGGVLFAKGLDARQGDLAGLGAAMLLVGASAWWMARKLRDKAFPSGGE